MISPKLWKGKNRKKGRLYDILTVKSNFKAMTIMAVLNSAQQLSSINVILMNMHTILEAAGSIYIDSSTSAIIFAVLMLIAVLVASIIIDKFGRKKLLITSSILTGLCLATIGIYFNVKNIGYNVGSISWVPIVSVMIYAFVFKIGLGMVPIVITAEIFASRIKAIGMTLADAVYVLMAIFAIQIYQLLLRWYGMHVPFYVFSCCSFLSAVFAATFVPETKGKTLDEIQLVLKGQYMSKKNSEAG
ncbi:hypothetical protein NQ317_015376 [Molorchus minor]|uniref:Major facilitator superfamily (MFS) profile domain-containing protein n=1 Tax=Molorchus minor TaxID=1323400 RepID=A0ABQ9J4F6_9CUCU|nr:hypothetical protein NQ317_015376 [Molorchus minor]